MNQAGELIVYQWKVLPFGLATAPRLFTKLLAPLGAHLHLHGCLMYLNIDNIFHAQVSASQTASTCDISLCCHCKLGFIINLKKSALVSSQVMLHLGALFDMARGLVFPSPAWTETIIHATQALLDLTQVSALRLHQVTGLLASCHALVPLCMFRLHPLSNLPPTHILTMDTSTYGWGVVCGPLMAKGVWSSDHSSLHINFLELEEIPEVAAWRSRPGSDRQHYGDALSEQDRRDQVQVLESQGDYSLVSEHEDYIVSSTFPGTGQCRGRSPLPVSNRESSLIGVSAAMNGLSTAG